jgi:hypothetical protein
VLVHQYDQEYDWWNSLWSGKNTATTQEKKGTRSKKASLPHGTSLYELLESTDEEEDKPERIYRIMTNQNHVRNFFAEECDKYIQLSLEKN